MEVRGHGTVEDEKKTDGTLLFRWSGTAMKNSVFFSCSLSILRVIHDLLSAMHDESRERAVDMDSESLTLKGTYN